MEIIKQSELDLDIIVGALREGQTLVYPTETCYGLGCDATNAEAVKQIFAIKKRQEDKPLLVVASSPAMMMPYVGWSPLLDALAKKYWPGPLTVVVPLTDGGELSPGVVGADRTMAFRVTNHPLASEITRQLGKPLVSTSANVASLESSYNIESILAMFRDTSSQPDIIIDAGPLPHRWPSTVVRIAKDGRLEVLRQGEVVVDSKLLTPNS